MRILVTGATGFVGSSLMPVLSRAGHELRLAVHNTQEVKNASINNKFHKVKFDLRSENNDYDVLLNDIDIVIHLAAKVHSMNDNGYEDYKRMNFVGTQRLAIEASKRVVKKFIYLSTIKVNGEFNSANEAGELIPFTENNVSLPEDPYARSKFESELCLKAICENSSMDYVILRPVLIYGPGVGANFFSLINAVSKRLPLPLSSVDNKRSIIYVKNLADMILTLVNCTKGVNGTYLASDFDVSFPQLHKEIAKNLNIKSLLFPFPLSILKLVGVLFGKKQVISRLTDSLLADRSKFISDLNWHPPYSFSEGIKETVDWYKNSKSI